MTSLKDIGKLFVGLFLVAGAFSARALAHEGLEEQVTQLTRRIGREPQNVELYVRRGELYRQLGQFQNARADYDRAQKVNPAMVEIVFYRGRLWLEAGRPANAKSELDAYLRLRPTHVEALFTRAKALEQLKEFRGAAADYTRALELTPRPTPDHFIARSQAQVAAGALSDALAGIEQAIEKLGPLVTLESQAIDIELRLKRWDRALARLDRMAAQSTRKESYLERRGAIQMQAGRTQDARASFAAALKALEALPRNLRQTKAMVDLERRTRAALL
jgi:tetratricopeptide (TPR) repeat protein